MKCLICGKKSTNKLCDKHNLLYKWENSIMGFRLRKKGQGSRYTSEKYHKNEIILTKIIENYYGKKNVITSYRPIWAISRKKVLYEFDIFIKNKNILIENQGAQHYEYSPFFHKTKKAFQQSQKRDKHKAILAKKNNFNLIFFKYDEPLLEDYVINKIEGK